jgi:uncharacterized protein
MVSQETIEEVKNRLVKTYDPVAIYLFGSYAWGCPTEDSDLDLLVVIDTSNEKTYARSRSGHYALFGLNVSKDIIVYTKEEFEKKIQDKATLGYKIKNEGKILYARA